MRIAPESENGLQILFSFSRVIPFSGYLSFKSEIIPEHIFQCKIDNYISYAAASGRNRAFFTWYKLRNKY